MTTIPCRCWKCGAHLVDAQRDIWSATLANPPCDDHEPFPTDATPTVEEPNR